MINLLPGVQNQNRAQSRNQWFFVGWKFRSILKNPISPLLAIITPINKTVRLIWSNRNFSNNVRISNWSLKCFIYNIFYVYLEINYTIWVFLIRHLTWTQLQNESCFITPPSDQFAMNNIFQLISCPKYICLLSKGSISGVVNCGFGCSPKNFTLFSSNGC